jgi:predicted AAA+ superfamily ATPase
VRKEITKAPIYYFSDLGFRNFLLGFFGRSEDSSQKGFLFQNFAFLLLHEEAQNSAFHLFYWRTKSGAEVDFVLNFGNSLLGIEVKYRSATKADVSRSLISFLEQYASAKGMLMNLSLQKQIIKKGDISVSLFPYFEKMLYS